MRPFVFVVATCLACTHAPAQMAQSTPVCPSPDSIKAARNSPPPQRARLTVPPPASGQVRIDIHEGPPREPYATFVIDSQYVFLLDQWARDSANNPLRDLPATDIVSIEVLKEKTAIERWRACPGVTVILITTKSKSSRSRAPASKPGE